MRFPSPQTNFSPYIPLSAPPPEDTPLERLAYVSGSRWRIETEFDTEKSDVGLDEYETRTWSGWQHHIALCLVVGAFLLSLQHPTFIRPVAIDHGSVDGGRLQAQGCNCPNPHRNQISLPVFP